MSQTGSNYMVVRDLQRAIRFYQEAFNFQVCKQNEQWATLTYGTQYFVFFSETYAPEALGYQTQSPLTSGITPPIAFSFTCTNVEQTVQQAVNAGARIIRQPEVTQSGNYVATLAGIEGYYWHVTDCVEQEQGAHAYADTFYFTSQENQ
jgi:lactoylglutathione lyase